MRFLNQAGPGKPFDTHQLELAFPGARGWSCDIAGLMAIPVSRQPRDYVVFFRKELVSQVRWAGRPEKIVSEEAGRIVLSPRRSFALWQETIRGQSEPWSERDQVISEALRVSLLEVMLQVTDRAEKRRKTWNDQQDILIAELNHRVRNILNLIIGVVRQSVDGATNVSQLAEEIGSRVHALARAHDQLTSGGWGARSFVHMLGVETAAYLGEKAERVVIHGDDIGIQPDAFATLALVFHELITNSAKYGALKDGNGQVGVFLSRREDQALAISWIESGGVPVKPPTRRGFGSTIINRAIPHELGGSAEIAFDPAGLKATFTVPLKHLTDGSVPFQPKLTSEKDRLSVGPARLDGSVLLVEDNLLIALESETMLQSLGASDVRVASNVQSALDAIADRSPDFAVLDYNLGAEQSVAVALRLQELGVPFVFATGYGDTSAISDELRQRPILTKPYSAAEVVQAYSDSRISADAVACTDRAS